MADWRHKPSLRWSYPIPFVILAILAYAMWNQNLSLFQLPQQRTFDTYQNFAPRRPSQNVDKIIVIDIDQRARNALTQWPWPRTRYAAMIDKLTVSGAKAVILDEVFSIKDQTSPDQIMETWWSTPTEGLQDALGVLSQLPDHDALFAQSFRSVPIITSFTLTRNVNHTAPRIKADVALPRDARDLKVSRFNGARTTISPLSIPSTGNGSRNITYDADGRVRTIPLISSVKDRIYPSTLLEAIRISEGVDIYEVMEEENETSAKLAQIKVGKRTISMTADGALYLHPTEQTPITHFSAADLLAGSIPSADLQNAFVFIGPRGNTIAPRVMTANGSTINETWLKAEALHQLLNDQYLQRPTWALWAELGTLALAAILIIALAYYASPLWAGVLTILSIPAMFYAGWYAFTTEALLIDVGSPAVSLILVTIATLIVTRIRTSAQREYVRTAFGHYLSPGAVNSIAQNTTSEAFVNAEKRQATVMVCGLRGFPALEKRYSEHPDELGHLINDFLTEMTAQVHQTQGTINRYLGDRFIATWNAPLSDNQHHQHAIECALRMLESLDHLNRRLDDRARAMGIDFAQVEMGVGISTGECIAGLMGSKLHDEYSVIGEAVRDAQHLFTSSETYGPAVIVSEETYGKVDHIFAMLEIDFVENPDKPHAQRIFALIGNPVMKANPKFRALEEAHLAFFTAFQAQNWEEAMEVIEQARELSGAIPSLYDLYAKRIYYYVQNPPDENWIGAHTRPVI